MNHEQTILEQFREREKEIKKECDRLDAEMDKKRQGQEKIQRAALDKLTKARAALAVMKADYHALEGELRAKAQADLEASEITGEKVKKGEATIRDFYESGLSPDALTAKAGEETRAKLAAAVKLIRDKATEIFSLEHEEAQARKETIFAASYPGQTQVKKLKAEIETLERGIGAVFGGYYEADIDVEKAKNNVSLCQEKTIGGLVWDSLTYDELCDLRLDPRIRDRERFKALEGLEEIIASAKPGSRYYLTMGLGWGREPGFIVRCLDDDEEGSRMITTTTTTTPVKK